MALVQTCSIGLCVLGTSLWDIIRLLRDQAALIPVVELKYSDEVHIPMQKNKALETLQ
jgi:hypothetical protein